MLFLEWLEGELNYYGEEQAEISPDQTWGGQQSPEPMVKGLRVRPSQSTKGKGFLF